MGVVLVDLTVWVINLARGGPEIRAVLGGGGVFGATVLAGIIAVLTAEIVGEIRERLQGGPMRVR
jgi:hypothetical protein